MIGHGSGTTLWRGSAFDCASSSNEISLLHNLHMNNNALARANGVCNNGSIVAQILRVDNGSIYVSQLNVTVSDSVVGKTIECNYIIYDNESTVTTKTIGEEIIHIKGTFDIPLTSW